MTKQDENNGSGHMREQKSSDASFQEHPTKTSLSRFSFS